MGGCCCGEVLCTCKCKVPRRISLEHDVLVILPPLLDLLLLSPTPSLPGGRYLKDTDGGLSLGPGPFVAALEYGSGRTAEVRQASATSNLE
jgi:hypothetical protein